VASDLVLITGAGGNLGAALTPELRRAGYRVRLLDVRRLDSSEGVEAMVGDVRRPHDLRRAVEGVGWVVHGAAWHGIHLEKHPPRDFWELNVDGTFNVYDAALQAGVQGIVFSSTMGVYGASDRPKPGEPAVRVHEQLPLQPTDIYGLSKVACEELARLWARTEKMRTIAVRFGMFVPETFTRYGVRLLYGGVDPRDVATSVLASLRVLERRATWFDVFNIESAVPFTADDASVLPHDPMSVIARHWPQARGLLAASGAELWGGIQHFYDISHAADSLGWRPQFNFGEFLEALRSQAPPPAS
jgi:nucleoside-diphosphate-sugar epimerase